MATKQWVLKPTIYLDMDECVCDFMSVYYQLEPKVDTPKKFHTMVMEHQIFTKLDWMPNGMHLVSDLEILEKDARIEMLTSLGTYTPEVAEEAQRQKTEWLQKKYIRWQPNFVNSWADKHRYATPFNILIDDRHDTCRSWREAGGLAVEYRDEAFPDMLDEIAKALQIAKRRIENQTQ